MVVLEQIRGHTYHLRHDPVQRHGLEHIQYVYVQDFLVGEHKRTTRQQRARLLVEELADDVTVVGRRDQRAPNLALVGVGALGVVIRDEEPIVNQHLTRQYVIVRDPPFATYNARSLCTVAGDEL